MERKQKDWSKHQIGDYIGQCTLCKYKSTCEHKIKCESIGFEIQICKYYEV